MGKDAVLTAANARGEIYRISKSDEYIDDNLDKISIGQASYINIYIPNESRMLKMATNALKEALSVLKNHTSKPLDIPFFMGLPSDRPGLSETLKRLLGDNMSDICNSQNISSRIEFIESGHSSGIVAMASAIKQFEDEETELAIIGGVESYLDIETIVWLKEKKLLKSIIRPGMVPGEAAGFCILATDKALQQYDLTPLVKIKSCGIAEEENDYDSKKESSGSALTAAITEAAFPVIGESKIHQLYSTLNGVPYYADEFAQAVLSVGKLFENLGTMQMFTKNWGDIGAATVPVYLSMITFHRTIKEAEGPYTLLFANSFGKQRSAILLEYLSEM